MEITLYPGESKSHLDYFTDFFDLQSIRYEISHCYFGHKIHVFPDDNDIDLLSSYICRFILDFYLKEAVLSKIYDEYPCFNTDDAGIILTKISQKLSATPIKDDVLLIISQSKALNPESYAAFNLKPLMLCIYAMTDEICEGMVYKKEKQELISMIRMFSKLSFDKCNAADVEFSADNRCMVTLDNGAPAFIHNDELLAFLAQRAPDRVLLKNTYFNPELANIVTEIFDLDK